MNGFAGKFGFVLLGEGGREGGSGEGEMPRITKGIRTLKMFCSNHWLGGSFGFYIFSLCVGKQRILGGSVFIPKAPHYSLLELSSWEM